MGKRTTVADPPRLSRDAYNTLVIGRKRLVEAYELISKAHCMTSELMRSTDSMWTGADTGMRAIVDDMDTLEKKVLLAYRYSSDVHDTLSRVRFRIAGNEKETGRR